jgi:hypothetical protein
MTPRPPRPASPLLRAARRLVTVAALAAPLSACMDASVSTAVVGATTSKAAQNGSAALDKANAAAATLATRLPAEPRE